MTKKDWGIFVICLFFMLSLILFYIYISQDYLNAVSNTVYPGKRCVTGGGAIKKLFYYAQAPFYAYKDIGNPCEVGVFWSLFPIPLIMSAYCWIRSKKKDLLVGGLLVVIVPMLLYVAIGFPEVIAKITLFSYSFPERVADIIGYMQIYFIIILLSRYEKKKKVPYLIACILAIITALGSVIISNYYYPNYLSVFERVCMVVVIAVLSIGLMIKMSKQIQSLLLAGLLLVSVVTGIYVRPISRGMGAIFSKPIAKEIQALCSQDKEAKWMTYGSGIFLSGYSVACGASTINSVNIYPNLQLWKKLDSKNLYEEIYNRYAHVSLAFIDEDTNFELNYLDHIQLNLSYKDIEKTNVKYLLTTENIEEHMDNEYVQFEKIYSEYGTSIYRLLYK